MLISYLQTSFSVLSVVIAFAAYIPYMRDIIKGRAVPARSARIMLTAVLLMALFQQQSLGSGLALAVTIGEVVGSLMILFLSLKKGVGGLARVDKICYFLLFFNLAIWGISGNALLALHLTVLADIIAFAPTLIKTWHWPKSETAVFYIAGSAAPVLSLAAQGSLEYSILLFPLYLFFINGVEILLIFRKKPGKKQLTLKTDYNKI